MNANSLRRRLCTTAAVLTIAVGGLLLRPLTAQPVVVADDATAPGGIKTVAVVALSSYDDLLSDANFAGSLGGVEKAGQQLEGAIGMFTNFRGLVGLDKTKPWGIILQTDGQQFIPIACLPVTDLPALLELVQGFGMQVNDGAGNDKVIPLPNGQSLQLREQNGWVYLSTMPGAFDLLPDDPPAVLAKLTDDYDLGIHLSMQNVPEMYRGLAMSAMQSGLQQGLERKADESDEEYEMRRKLAEAQMAQFERMFTEIDTLTIGWALDATQQRTYLDVTYGFVPGSKMAQQIEAYGQPRTNFAGFYQPGAAATMSVASQADPDVIQEDLDQMRAMLATWQTQAEKAIDQEEGIPDDATRDAIKSALGDFLDAFQTTIEGGKMDGGAALVVHEDALTLVVGAHVKEPLKIESGFKKLADVAQKRPNFPGVQWNADSHAGANFHSLSVPLPAEKYDQKVRAMLGDKIDVAIGIGDETVYLALGRDNLNAVKEAIDASQREPGKAVPPFELSVSLGPIVKVIAANAGDDNRDKVETIANMLESDAQGRDHVRITGKLIEDGFTYRIEAEEGVLRAIGKAVTMIQQQRQQQAFQNAQ